MSINIAINGFGRIGRLILRAIVENEHHDLRVVAINDLASPDRLAGLLKFDSVHGKFPLPVSVEENKISIGDLPEIQVFKERDPENLPWKRLNIDLVMECTGFFLTQDLSGRHIMAGAKRVLMSAPPKDDTKTIVYGVNDNEINANDKIISNASCTTNALAPLLTVLHKEFGIQSGMMTTVHAYTGDQPTLDAVHSDPYRGRAAALSMIPTSTGAARAIGRVLPELDGKLEGTAIHVPVPNVSLVDLSVLTEKKANSDSIRQSFKSASEKSLKGILGYVSEPMVSSDFNHDPHSSSFVDDQVFVNNDHFVRVMAWYDNEWGFSNRMLDTARVIGKFI